MTPSVPFVVSRIAIDDGDVVGETEVLPRQLPKVAGLRPDWTIAQPPPSLHRRTQFSATPLVCGIPVVAVANLHFNALAAEINSGALSQ